jgi:hypothetical protein
MTTGLGAPPKTGWAKLVPELLVSDIVASLEFWRDRRGFAIAYQRPEPAFAYLERPEGAQIMLCQRSGNWETAPLEPPYGRGAMFQVYVASIALPEGRSGRSDGPADRTKPFGSPPPGEIGSQRTLRWREVDSNYESRHR